MGTQADQTAAEIPGGTGRGDGCSESLPSASALSPLPTPQLPSRLLVLSLVTGQWCWGWQSQQIHQAGDAGRLEPSVHESAQLWCSCQWETKQRHLEDVPRGPVHAGEKEASGTRRTWPQTLMPPLTSSVTSGSRLTSPSLRVLLHKIGIIEPDLPNSQVVERIK